MFGIGFQEVMVIFIVVLIVFGPKKLPELARMIGRTLGEFRRATYDLKSAIDLNAYEHNVETPSSTPSEPVGKSDGHDEEMIPDMTRPVYEEDEIEMPEEPSGEPGQARHDMDEEQAESAGKRDRDGPE